MSIIFALITLFFGIASLTFLLFEILILFLIIGMFWILWKLRIFQVIGFLITLPLLIILGFGLLIML